MKTHKKNKLNCILNSIVYQYKKKKNYLLTTKFL